MAINWESYLAAAAVVIDEYDPSDLRRKLLMTVHLPSG
jgi:hypothetical protein